MAESEDRVWIKERLYNGLQCVDASAFLLVAPRFNCLVVVDIGVDLGVRNRRFAWIVVTVIDGSGDGPTHRRKW